LLSKNLVNQVSSQLTQFYYTAQHKPNQLIYGSGQTAVITGWMVKQAVAKHKITIATLAKAAWAVTMKTYTQQDTVVFGSVVSGRDIPVENVERYYII
jgi:hypothetical protein